MTHLPSANEYTRRAKGGPKKQDQPRPGTRLRALYDRLMEAGTRPTPLADIFDDKQQAYHALGNYISQLTDFYGLDIHKARQGGTKRGPSLYYLAGYWDGTRYVDLAALMSEPRLLAALNHPTEECPRMPQRHHRELIDYLKDTYRATGVHVTHGGKHPHIAFIAKGRAHSYTVPSTPGDTYRGNRNARADLRRILGDPPPHQPTPEPRTLEEMTSMLNAEPFNPAIPEAMRAKVQAAVTTQQPHTAHGTLVLSKSNKCLALSVPPDIAAQFAGKLAVRFTPPDLFEVYPSPARKSHFKPRNDATHEAFFGASDILNQVESFPATRAELVVADGTLLARVLTPPKPATNQHPPNITTPLSTGRVANYRDCTRFYPPDELLNRWRNPSAPRAHVHLLGDDVWEIRHAKDGPSFRTVEGRTELTVGLPTTPDGLFGISPATYTLVDDTLLVVLGKRTPLKRQPQPAYPTKRVAADPTPVLPALESVPHAAAPIVATASLSDLLTDIRRIEATTPYRLTRVRDKTTDAEHWEWRAPAIR